MNVLFIGSFKEQGKDGSVGGQMFACRSLLSASAARAYSFFLVDSTADSVPAPPIYIRLLKAIFRLLKSLYYLIFCRVHVLFIFSSAGFSFKEKGVLVLVAKLFRKKVVFFPRSGLIKDDLARSNFNRWFATRVVTSADYVICQGQEWRQFYSRLNGNDDAKLVIIQNWIDASKYSSIGRNGSRQVPVILYLGWLEDYKGIWDLLEVSEKLAKKGFSFKVDVYGAGKLQAKIQRYIEGHHMHSYFSLNGWANEFMKMKALSDADIFVLPSYREGFPNALLEAMAAGLPSIGSRVGGVPGLIDHGINGFLIEPGNQAMLEQYLIQLLQDKELRNMFSNNSITRVRSNNSVASAWSKLSPLLEL